MPKLDVARARLEHRTPDEFSALSIAGDRVKNLPLLLDQQHSCVLAVRSTLCFVLL